MSWFQLKINACNEDIEQIGEQLSEQGALSVSFQDSQDNPIFEPLPGETRLWSETDIIALFDIDTNMDALIDGLKQHPLFGAKFHYQIETLADKNWEREWMDHFHPMRFGQRLWICPSWCEVPDPNAVNILLDPGLAFGTGTHPTTALCLSWLDGLDLQGKTVIDFGCGSGILAIAALKLGAAQAIGIDIDPQALEASRDNANRNGVADRLALYLADQQPENLSTDILVANILAGPLRELAPTLSKLVRPNGLLCLSGVLTEQAESVTAAYLAYFKLDPIEIREDWCQIGGVKTKD